MESANFGREGFVKRMECLEVEKGCLEMGWEG